MLESPSRQRASDLYLCLVLIGDFLKHEDWPLLSSAALSQRHAQEVYEAQQREEAAAEPSAPPPIGRWRFFTFVPSSIDSNVTVSFDHGDHEMERFRVVTS